MSDFQNVFGDKLTVVLPRLGKGLQVGRDVIKGEDVASNRLPIKIQLEITDRCNFDCVMCARNAVVKQRAKPANDLPLETCRRLIDEIRPHYLTLNGNGEPLLYQDLPALLKLCRDRHITTSMPTNMSRMNRKRRRNLLKWPPNILTFSLHGAHSDTFAGITCSTSFQECLDNFEALLAETNGAPMQVRILFALQKTNLYDFDAMFDRLTQWNMVESCYLVPVFEYDEKNSDQPVGLTAQDRQDSLDELDQAIGNCPNEPKKQFLIRWRNAVWESRTQPSVETGPCFFPWYFAYIEATGDVHPCCYMSGDRHVMGNINSTSFEEIWNGAPFRAFRARLRDDRRNLCPCNHCPRNDLVRLNKYRFITLGKTRWPVQASA